MDHVFCTECGAENPADNAFCVKCGARLDKGFLGDDDASGSGTPGETVYVPPAPPRPDPPVPSDDTGRSDGAGNDGRHRGGAGKIVGITLASVCGVLAAAFVVFYFTDPFGLFGTAAVQQEEGSAVVQPDDPSNGGGTGGGGEVDVPSDGPGTDGTGGDPNGTGGEGGGSSSDDSTGGSSTSDVSSPPAVYVGPNGIEYTHHVNSEYSDDYILPDSARRLYSVDELSNLSNYELYLGRNEILARYGRIFKEGDLDGHYRSTDWYIPLYDGGDFDSVMLEEYLNDYEYKNMIVIRDLERERGSEYL